MNINHAPLFKTDVIEEIYTKKDGVPVKYVCTTELEASNAPMDVFYRETPHPEFGNRYFGMFFNRDGDPMITSADSIEKFNFSMVESKDGLEYSRYRHDCRIVEGKGGKNVMIDGGRAYTRAMGPTRSFKVVDGKFVEFTEEDNEQLGH